MAPPRKIFNKTDADKYCGGKGLRQYFKPKKKLGRPKKKKGPAGRPKTNLTKPSAEPTENSAEKSKSKKPPPPPSPPPPPLPKKPRTNWSTSNVMKKAVHAWDSKSGDALDENGDASLTYQQVAARVGIPPKTFYHYINPDIKKRRTVGKAQGRSRMLTDGAINLLGETIARQDRANDGMNTRETIDTLIEMEPKLNREQARQQIKNVIVPQNTKREILKPKMVKAQATTSERTSITPAQQYR